MEMVEKSKYYIQVSTRSNMKRRFELDHTFTFGMREDAEYALDKLKNTHEYRNRLLRCICMPNTLDKDR